MPSQESGGEEQVQLDVAARPSEEPKKAPFPDGQSQSDLETELLALMKEYDMKTKELTETENQVAELEKATKDQDVIKADKDQDVIKPDEPKKETDTPAPTAAETDAVPTVREDPGYQRVKESLLDDADFTSIDNDSQPKSCGGWCPTLHTETMNKRVLKGSALSYSLPIQIGMYLVALGGVVFVLVATAENLGGDDDSSSSASSSADGSSASSRLLFGEDADHRGLLEMVPRLLADAGSGSSYSANLVLDGSPSLLMTDIAYSLTGAGLVALLVNMLQLPLILGYLLGGVLVGPIGLNIVEDDAAINDIASLGLAFLLFMIGLELDLRELAKMGPVVLGTGFFQYIVCTGAHIGCFMGLDAMGITFGDTKYTIMYCGACCGISSTMIVAKLLAEKGEMDSNSGRLTVGILIFQDIWAIVVLAIQPKLDNPDIVEIIVTLLKIICLIGVAGLYAKFVMPALLYFASKSVELMLVTSLAWCFFIACVAMLGFMGLSVELASLIAGAALATFPYSAEFNGKIKYIRDYFITLFFVRLGMQIPTPEFETIVKGWVIAVVVLICRWLGIWLLVVLSGGGRKLGTLATLNLSQISEFALVICQLGRGFDPPHVSAETQTYLIWTFSMLALQSSTLVTNKEAIYRRISALCSCRKASAAETPHGDGHGHDEEHEARDIILLGFHKISHMLISELQKKQPVLLKKVHVIHFDQELKSHLDKIGVKFSYGDISSVDVLEHCHHGECKIVLSTIPDSMLMGLNNAELLNVMKTVWPKALHVVTGESPVKAKELYNSGAGYVLRMEKLCAERLGHLLEDQFAVGRTSLLAGGVFDHMKLVEIFEQFKAEDKDWK